jgi:hypothetical protein
VKYGPRQSVSAARKSKTLRDRSRRLDLFLMIIFWGAVALVYGAAIWIAFQGALFGR